MPFRLHCIRLGGREKRRTNKRPVYLQRITTFSRRFVRFFGTVTILGRCLLFFFGLCVRLSLAMQHFKHFRISQHFTSSAYCKLKVAFQSQKIQFQLQNRSLAKGSMAAHTKKIVANKQ